MDQAIYQIMQALQMREVDAKGVQLGYTITGTQREALVNQPVKVLTTTPATSSPAQ